MKENEIAKIVVDSSFKIHQKYGPGLLESVYEKILFYELQKKNLSIESQVSIPIIHENVIIDEGFRADLIVQNKVVIELKSVEFILPVHKKQLLTYLKLTNSRLGLLINFGSALFKNGVTRVVNGLEEN